MKIKYFDAHSEKTFAMDPKQTIAGMYDFTKENGTLIMPVYTDDHEEGDEEFDSYIKCDMAWNQSDCESAINEYESLYSKLSDIAKKYDQLGDSIEENKDILTEEELDIWDTFIRDFGDYGFDYEKIREIEDKLFYSEDITDEESKYYDEYFSKLVEECKKRVGPNYRAYQVVIRAKRTCRLLALGAPEIIINNEAKYLAEAFVMHKFAKSYEETSMNKD